MTGGSRIVALGPEENRPDTPAETVAEAVEATVEAALPEAEEEEGTPPHRHAWLLPTFAALAVLGWTGFFGYAHQAEMIGSASLQQWSGWVTQWAIPVILVVGLWLLAMRSSRREASRFGDVARLLSEETARLEARLVTVNRELSLAREFLAAQSRELESVGRVASERLSENAERMTLMIHQNSAQIESIASVSSTALENMDKLRGELPVIATSARDVTSQIGNAGRTAHGQLEELIKGFHRLNAFGEASERQVESLRTRIDAAMTDFESQSAALSEAQDSALASLRERIDTLRADGSSLAQAVREGEEEALDKWGAAITGMRERLTEALLEVSEIDEAALERTRSRLAALDEEARRVDAAMAEQVEAFMEAVESRRSAHEAQVAEITQALESRFANVDAAIADRHHAQLAHVEAMAERGETLAEKLAELNGQMETIAARGSRVGGELSQAIELLSTRLKANKEVLQSTDKAVMSLTDASVRLLELIQAGAEHSREQLPEAIAIAEQHLSAFEERTRELGVMLSEADQKGQALSDYVLSAQRDSKAVLEELEDLHSTLSERESTHAERIEGLRSAITSLGEESDKISERVRGDLSEAVERLQGALRLALDELGSGQSEAVDDLAERIGDQSIEAIERVIKLRASEAIGELEQAAAHASGVGREAARQLRDQLAKVDELAGNLESRVARARQRAEEQVDNDFARRVALITESLNSNAIDISKALSNDVTDTAWASYLRGDRGIFTRRAVRLLDNSEAREVAEIYDRDHDFREHVSRYIHDFEAMLRTLLSTRDGHALGVTLLSSDMGKLYVALAQAIERLRD